MVRDDLPCLCGTHVQKLRAAQGNTRKTAGGGAAGLPLNQLDNGGWLGHGDRGGGGDRKEGEGEQSGSVDELHVVLKVRDS